MRIAPPGGRTIHLRSLHSPFMRVAFAIIVSVLRIERVISTDSSHVIYLLGNVPERAEWLGEYVQQGTSKVAKHGLIDGRPYYAKRADDTKLIWFNKHTGRWYAGRTRALGKAAGVLHVNDVAATPDLISSGWQVWHGPVRGWVSAPEIRVLTGDAGRAMIDAEATAIARSPASVTFVGEMPSGVRHEWLGRYEKQTALTNGHHRYRKTGDDTKMLWYNAGTWYIGNRASLGRMNGVLMAHDVATSPERIRNGAWMVGQGEGKGWVPAPNLRCIHGTEEADAALVQAGSLEGSPHTIYLLEGQRPPGTDAPKLPRISAWQGAYTVQTSAADGRLDLQDGRFKYTHIDPSGRGTWCIWYQARTGTWQVGNQRPGSERTKTLFSSYDDSLTPIQIKSPWRASQRGGWAPVSLRVAGPEGAAVLREQQSAKERAVAMSAETVLLVGLSATEPMHEWLGRYTRRTSTLVHGRHVLVHDADETKVLWYDAKTASWCAAMHEAAALQQMHFFANRAVLRAPDPALAPERIVAKWEVRGEDPTVWASAASLRCIAASEGEGAAELRRQERTLSVGEPVVYLVGPTPPSFDRAWMGPYERQPSGKPSGQLTFRRKHDWSRELYYHANSGEWRVGRRDAHGESFVMAVYDGALLPERISTPWRVLGDIGWEEAPMAKCTVGTQGQLAMAIDQKADRAAASLKRALTPGWIFRVKVPEVSTALHLALQAGVQPSHAYALISKARLAGVQEAVLEAARQQLAVAAPLGRPVQPSTHGTGLSSSRSAQATIGMIGPNLSSVPDPSASPPVAVSRAVHAPSVQEAREEHRKAGGDARVVPAKLDRPSGKAHDRGRGGRSRAARDRGKAMGKANSKAMGKANGRAMGKAKGFGARRGGRRRRQSVDQVRESDQ